MPSGAEYFQRAYNATAVPSEVVQGSSSSFSAAARSETIPPRAVVRCLPLDKTSVHERSGEAGVHSTEVDEGNNSHKPETETVSGYTTEAQRFLSSFGRNRQLIAALTGHDATPANAVRERISLKIRSLKPHVSDEHALPDVDARLEVASKLIDHLPFIEAPRVFAAGIQVLYATKVPEVHLATLRRELVRVIHRNDASDYPNPQTERVLQLSRAVSHQLPDDQQNGRLVMDAWASYIDRFSDDKERNALLAEVCKLFQTPKAEGYNFHNVHSRKKDGALQSVYRNLGFDYDQLGDFFAVGRQYAYTATRHPQPEHDAVPWHRGEMHEVYRGHILDILADGQTYTATSLAEHADGQMGDSKNVAKVIKTMLPMGTIQKIGSTNGARYRRVPVSEWKYFVPDTTVVNQPPVVGVDVYPEGGVVEEPLDIVTDTQAKKNVIATVLAGVPDIWTSSEKILELTNGNVGTKNTLLVHLKSMREAGVIEMSGKRGQEKYRLRTK